VIVWSGGALFVVSLAWCAWWYLFTAGGSRPYSGPAAIAADTLLFALFALHHSLFARDTAKSWLNRVPADLQRSLYVSIASLLLIVVCAVWQPIGGDLYRAGRLSPLHVAVQIAGLWVIAKAVSKIDPLELAGIRPARSAEPLQTSGPYRWVRHPLYLGWVLVVFATPHVTGDRLAFAALSTAYLIAAVPWEERSLVGAFGDDYIRYQRDVRWRIIPFIY
jgi:protein-S-isoprenylcysteine O-methyltransferase Ste14